MAKKPTLTTVSSGFQSTSALQNNLNALRDGFDNTLSLDGSTPNAMNADLDMNNNDILNAKSVTTESLTLDGTPVTAGEGVTPSDALDTMAAVEAYTRTTDVVVLTLRGGETAGDGLGGQWVYDPAGVAETSLKPDLLVGADGANYVRANKEPLHYNSVDDLLSSTISFAQNTKLKADIHTYEVALSAATDHHLTTAGGVKLNVIPTEKGFNFLAWGVDPQGVEDSTSEFIAAVENPTVDILYAPGSFRIEGDATCTVTEPFTLEGSGRGVTKFNLVGYQQGIRLIGDGTRGDFSTYIDGINVKNLTVCRPDYEDFTGSITNKSLYIACAKNSVIENVEEWGAIGFGIQFDDCVDVAVRNCFVHDHFGDIDGPTGTDGIHFYRCSDYLAEGNVVRNMGDDAISSGSFQTAEPARHCYRGRYIDNLCEDIQGAAHKVYSYAHGVEIRGNTARNIRNGGTYLTNDANNRPNSVVEDIYIEGNHYEDCWGLSGEVSGALRVRFWSDPTSGDDQNMFITADMTSASNDATMSDASVLNVGQVITIAGAVTDATITAIVGNVVTLGAAAGATVSDAGVTAQPPAYAVIRRVTFTGNTGTRCRTIFYHKVYDQVKRLEDWTITDNKFWNFYRGESPSGLSPAIQFRQCDGFLNISRNEMYGLPGGGIHFDHIDTAISKSFASPGLTITMRDNIIDGYNQTLPANAQYGIWVRELRLTIDIGGGRIVNHAHDPDTNVFGSLALASWFAPMSRIDTILLDPTNGVPAQLPGLMQAGWRGNGFKRRATAPTVGTHQEGDVVKLNPQTAATSQGWTCVTRGTTGVAVGVTGSITTGTPDLVVNDASLLYVGQTINVTGAANAVDISAISGTDITLDANATATVEDAQVFAPYSTLPSVTADMTNTEFEATVSDTDLLYVGQYITIAGAVTRACILQIEGSVLTLDTASGADVSGAAVSFAAPVFAALPALA